MKEQLTFKQYLSSKASLREAIHNTPKQIRRYKINKYCKIVLGESNINLKPKNVILVEWEYKDIENPLPIKIIMDSTEYKYEQNFWTASRLTKWLLRNASET